MIHISYNRIDRIIMAKMDYIHGKLKLHFVWEWHQTLLVPDPDVFWTYYSIANKEIKLGSTFASTNRAGDFLGFA